MNDFNALSWPLARLGEGLEALARKSGFTPTPVETIPPPPHGDSAELLARWIKTAADCLGVAVEPVETGFTEVERLVRNAGPSLLSIPNQGELRFLLLLRGGRRQVAVLGSDLAVHKLSPDAISTALCREYEGLLASEVDGLLSAVGVPTRRRARARAVMLRERLGPLRVGGCWLVRLPAGAQMWHQMRVAGLPRRLLLLLGTYLVQSILGLLTWWIIGRGALEGRLDWGWLSAWVLLLFTQVPLRLFVMWSQGLVAIGVGTLLKQRLLDGALRLEPEEIRHQGAGQLFGRIIESQAVEALALSSGLLGLTVVVDLILAGIVLSLGAGGFWHGLLLLGWIAVVCVVSWRYFGTYDRWTQTRRDMTHDLVERMVGHRTRLAQETRARWHVEEDQNLERYLVVSREMDRTAVVQALLPRGWLVVGMAGLGPALVLGVGSPATLAVSLGGVLLAYQALAKLGAGLAHLTGAAIAWKQVAPVFHAASRPETSGSPTFALAFGSQARESRPNGQSVIDAHDLVFRYAERRAPVLQGCSVRIGVGDRILLEGPSGGGKSTLASLLIGLRRPESGLLLLRGLDRQTVGTETWRQHVVAAPQFHENHILSGTFAFNLLMGRCWPPRPQDMVDAEALCHKLGLGELLGRMPAGLLQIVGETGWQLSHGERSRLFIARALLQDADLVILDESFAALDPETLHQSLRCVLDQAPTLLVIAHP